MNENSSDHSTKALGYVILGLLVALGAGVAVWIVAQSAVLGVVVGVGVLIIVGLFVTVVAARNTQQSTAGPNYLGLGIAIGAGFGVAHGVAMSVATDSPAFLGVGVALGVGSGVSIGTALNARKDQEDK